MTLGREVGYAVRFEDCTSAATRIKYLTGGAGSEGKPAERHWKQSSRLRVSGSVFFMPPHSP